ncbi:MAG: extracellular solute-binding protein family 1 [Herbinix sp.]|jgi:arabinogalactan oligomer/maltooligosaccharide transport system substrate-binding protein|nr:extracellular solute-binding protein family 1 [Herbinix sp.]
MKLADYAQKKERGRIMKKVSRLIALLMVTLMVVGSFAACGKKAETTPEDTNKEATVQPTEAPAATEVPAAPEDVTLTVWAPENQIQTGTMDAMCASFQALHPEWKITFTVVTQGEDTAKDEILKDVAAAGDVFFFANDQLTGLVNAGAIARLGGSTEEMVKSTMAEAVVDTVTVDDAIYAIPFTHNTFFMYYDKSLLTADDVKSIEGIMAKPTAEDVYNFCFDSAGGWKLGSWYYGAGLTIYGDSQVDFAAGANWNNATGLAVTNYLIDLINNPKCAYADDVSLSELAADHRIGAWFDGSWNYDLYKTALGDDLGLAIIPTFNPDGTDYQLKGFYGSKAIGVNAQAKFMPVAVAFAAYLGGEEMQLQRFEETAQVPTNLTVGASEAVQANEVAAVIVNEANNASVMQPTAAEFGERYWSNVAAFTTEIRSGDFNKTNAQEKLDTFVASLAVK